VTLVCRRSLDSHLRLLIGVDQQSGTFKTATPLEPVVADVAATMLIRNDGRKSEKESWTDFIQKTSTLLEGGIIEKATEGELFGRLLCILARDELPDGLSAKDDFRYFRQFKVEMFLN